MELKIGSLAKLYALLLLREGPKHGYEIMKETGKRLGKGTSPGLIYPFLNRLKKEKYLETKKKGARRKKVYALTKKGRELVKGVLARFSGLFEIALGSRLSVCEHCGCKVYAGGCRKKINKRELTFCCHYCAESFKGGQILQKKFVRSQHRASLDV